MIVNPLIGQSVTLEDGATGVVVSEWDGWQSEAGTFDRHRLRVALRLATCVQCPHGGAAGPVTVFRTVDASSVVPAANSA